MVLIEGSYLSPESIPLSLYRSCSTMRSQPSSGMLKSLLTSISVFCLKQPPHVLDQKPHWHLFTQVWKSSEFPALSFMSFHLALLPPLQTSPKSLGNVLTKALLCLRFHLAFWIVLDHLSTLQCCCWCLELSQGHMGQIIHAIEEAPKVVNLLH